MTDVTFVQPSYLDGKEAVVEYAEITESPEVKERGGIYIPTGRTVQRVKLVFADGKTSRSKSKHWVSFFGNEFDDVTEIPNGFRVKVGYAIRFFMVPTEYANGKTYDVIGAGFVDNEE